MTYHYGERSPLDCLYNAARAYPGGIEALAVRMGIKPQVLRNKLSPANHLHKPTYEEASKVMEYCAGAGVPDAFDSLHAYAFGLGYVCVPIPSAEEDLSQEALATLAFQLTAQFGDALNASTQALSDDHLSEKELEVIEPKIRKFQRYVTAFLGRLRQRVKRDRVRQAA